ncbi:MAG: TlpA disulfide reductase family protein [Cyclobacteriaceae bacterium]
MKKSFFTLLLIATLAVHSQSVETVTFAELQKKILYTEAPLTIFNFWTTWCGPCIKEMPHFDAINEGSSDVKVYFVSVDFKQDFEKIKKLIDKRNIKSEVLFLDEKDPDSYMRKVSPDWSGAIPATLFVNNLGKTFFYEKAFTKEELEKAVEKYLN